MNEGIFIEAPFLEKGLGFNAVHSGLFESYLREEDAISASRETTLSVVIKKCLARNIHAIGEDNGYPIVMSREIKIGSHSEDAMNLESVEVRILTSDKDSYYIVVEGYPHSIKRPIVRGWNRMVSPVLGDWMSSPKVIRAWKFGSFLWNIEYI